MLSRLAVQLQVRCFSRSGGFWDRFTREQFRQRIYKQNLKDITKTVNKEVTRDVAYRPDSIPVRPISHLGRALAFTVGTSTVAYVVAAISDEENRRSIERTTLDRLRKFYDQSFQDAPEMRELSPGEKCAVALVLANCIVTALWRVKSLQPVMWRYFSNSFASRSLCWPMMLSTFSHSSLIHLGLNMYVLWTFTQVSIDKFFGAEHFWAFYLTAGVVSSLTSLAHKAVIRSPIRALGASGAILGLLTYTCCKVPDARLRIVFIPNFDFSAQNAVIGLILFDLVGMLFKFKLFDHAAHLGGSLFGVAYALYGEDVMWQRCRRVIVRWWNRLKGGNQ